MSGVKLGMISMQPNVAIQAASQTSELGVTGNAITAVIGMMTIEIAVQDVVLYVNGMILQRK